MKKIVLVLMMLLLVACKNDQIIDDPFEESVVEVTLPSDEPIKNEPSIDSVEETLEESVPDAVVEEVPVIVIEEVELTFKEQNQKLLSSDDVLWLQESLKIAGYYTSRDGDFGTATQNMLEVYQEANQLEVGLYDEITKESLVMSRMQKEAPRLGTDLVMINKNYYLPSSFVPDQLRQVDVASNKEITLPEHVALQVERMFDDARADGVKIVLASGYRSYDYQEGIFSRRVNNHGFEEAEKVVAIPGESEHQTGLAIDVTSAAMDFGLDQSFDETATYKWLSENCFKYGFILRYMSDKTEITKYVYEPWHYRYVGDVTLATKIMQEHLSLEEYFGE